MEFSFVISIIEIIIINSCAIELLKGLNEFIQAKCVERCALRGEFSTNVGGEIDGADSSDFGRAFPGMTSYCRQKGLGKIGPHVPILAPTKLLGFALVLRFDHKLRVRNKVGRKYEKAQAGPPAEGSSSERQRAKQVCIAGARGSWGASGRWMRSSSPRRGLVAGS